MIPGVWWQHRLMRHRSGVSAVLDLWLDSQPAIPSLPEIRTGWRKITNLLSGVSSPDALLVNNELTTPKVAGVTVTNHGIEIWAGAGLLEPRKNVLMSRLLLGLPTYLMNAGTTSYPGRRGDAGSQTAARPPNPRGMAILTTTFMRKFAGST